MNKVKVLSGVIFVLLIVLIGGGAVLYSKIIDLGDSVSSLHSQVYSLQNDSPAITDTSSKVGELESKISELEYELRKTKTLANEAKEESEDAGNKFYSLCMIHNICNL